MTIAIPPAIDGDGGAEGQYGVQPSARLRSPALMDLIATHAAGQQGTLAA